MDKTDFIYIAPKNILRYLEIAFSKQKAVKKCTIISDWQPATKYANYGGLKKALEFRMKGDLNPIIILSFLPESSLLEKDKYRILAMPGTYHLRLPIIMKELAALIVSFEVLKEDELKAVQIEIYKKDIHTVLLQLKHGSRLDFVNELTGPLRSCCIAVKSKLATLDAVHQQLQRIALYIKTEVISRLTKFAKGAHKLNEENFADIYRFVCILNEISTNTNPAEADLDNLIILIDDLNQIYSTILKA